MGVWGKPPFPLGKGGFPQNIFFRYLYVDLEAVGGDEEGQVGLHEIA